MGAFAEMPGDVSRICDITANDLARIHVSYYNGDAKRKIHGSAHRGANGVAMPTDEDDQDGHFFYNHPERGAYSAA